MEDSKLPDSNDTGTGVSTPQLDKKTLKVGRRAIKDETQAWSVFSAMKLANDQRNKINAEIVARYAGKQPHDPRKMTELGRSWASNFPTRFLAGIIDRVVPNLINSIDSVRYLTQATLPDKIEDKEIPDRDKKIEIFREKITQRIRNWPEWRNFSAALCQEDVLIGYCFACWTDEDTPWPTLYRQDKAFVPEGSPQFAKYFQVFGIEQPILLHELVDIIQDREAADTAGWDIDNCVDSINHALPQDPARQTGSNEREFADAIREGNQGASYMTGAKVINLAHLFSIEPDKKKGKGRITHMILDADSKKLLFERERRFDSMSDVVAPFSLEPGNSKLYGSRGLGPMLVNLSIGVDNAVNDAVDAMKMAGLLIIKTDSKTAIDTQIKIRAPFAVVSGIGTLQKEQIPSIVEDFVALYEQLTKIAEVAAGAYIPNQISDQEQGGHRTAREATIDYTRELQSKSAFIARFAGQFAEMVNTIQKRLCQKDSTDEDAKELQDELEKEGLSRKEIDLLAESPAMEVVQDLSGVENQQKAKVGAQFAGHPMVDQKKLLEATITAMTNPQFAKEIILPEAVDQSVESEAVRQQLMENSAIMTGESIPVSPRDNDEIHLKVLAGELKRAGISLSQQNPESIDPELLDHISAALIHGDAHIQNWMSKGAKPEQVKPYQQFFAMADKMLQSIGQAMQQRAAQAKQVLSDQAAIQQRDQMGQQMDQIPSGQEPPSVPLTEKIVTAWIGQYDKLPEPEKRRLEIISGLGEQAGNMPEQPANIPPVTQPPISQPPNIQLPPQSAPPPPQEPNPVELAASQSTVPPPIPPPETA